MWGQQGFTWKKPFLDSLARDFGAGMFTVDYIGARAAARRAVNAWVSRRTAGTITDLIDSTTFDELTRLTLVNAAHLKAPWASAFERSTTRPAPFTRADGSVVHPPTMTTEQGLRYRRDTDWEAVDLPYAGNQLAMTVVLPRPGRFADVQRGLTGASLSKMMVGHPSQQRDIRLSLPRWTMRTRAPLVEILPGMGMATAFDAHTADLSGMTSTWQLHISAVEHQAWIAVDEQGTEASAATAVVVEGTAARVPLTLAVDRPYLFILQDTATSTPLFIGRVSDPSAGASPA